MLDCAARSPTSGIADGAGRAASVGNRASPQREEASRGVLSSASDDDGGGSKARCASSSGNGSWPLRSCGDSHDQSAERRSP